MADGLGRMPLAPKVDILKAEIGGHERFVSGRDAKGGAVVANADGNCGPVSCTGTYPLDDRLFTERQANSIYKMRPWSGPGRVGSKSRNGTESA